MTGDVGSIPMDDPLAFYLTWTAYGTWLPGDERGWVAKPGHFEPPDPERKAAAERLMTEPALTLDEEQRAVVEKTIADHCTIRRWHLHAVNCRTRHVHVVVTAPKRDPEEVMDQFKAWCTRRLKELEVSGRASSFRVSSFAGASGLCAEPGVGENKPEAPAKEPPAHKPEAPAKAVRQNWWTQRGSKRFLNDEASLEAAVRYVLEGQGEPTPHNPHKPEAPAKEASAEAPTANDPLTTEPHVDGPPAKANPHKPEAQAKDNGSHP